MNSFLLKYAILSLRRQPLRSWTTLISVILSAFLMFSVLSIGQGFSDVIRNELSMIGNDKITVLPIPESQLFSSCTFRHAFTKRDVERVKNVPGVVRVTGFVFGRAKVVFGGEEADILVYGIEPSGFEMWSSYSRIADGRKFQRGKEAVIGYSVANDVFSKVIRVGNKIIINNVSFRVVGTLEKIGVGFSSTDDQSIIIPLSEARKTFQFIKPDEIHGIMVQILPEEETQVVEELKRMFRNKDVSIITPEFVEEKARQIMDTARTFSFLLGFVSVIISSLGVANTLYTSVYEKKKELAILRAIGMTQQAVIFVSVLEGILLTGIGGLVGVILSLPLMFLKIPYSLSLENFAVTIFFSLLPGVIGSYIPAKKISRLGIIDVLRE